MSRRDPNLSAAIYATVLAGLTLGSLVLALLLPGTILSSRWLPLATIGAMLLIGYPMLDRAAHRSRIRESIGELGGVALRIKRLPFWRQPACAWTPWNLGMARRIVYEVEYEDLFGVRHRARCRSGWFHGVEWLEDFAISEG